MSAFRVAAKPIGLCPLWVTKRTWRVEFAMSALPPEADIAGRRLDVRFVPKTDIKRAVN
jgi:hypothetical protein